MILVACSGSCCTLYFLTLCRRVKKCEKYSHIVAFYGGENYLEKSGCVVASFHFCVGTHVDGKLNLYSLLGSSYFMSWLQIACWLPQLSFRSLNTVVLHWSLRNWSGLNLICFEFEDWFIPEPLGYGKESGKNKMLAIQLLRLQRARQGETNRKQKQQENLQASLRSGLFINNYKTV